VNADHTALTFKLRDGVKWHDGKPFTADDVKCTFDLLINKGKEKLRLNYRESWWVNSRRDHGRQPERGHAAYEEAPAGFACFARVGRYADLSLPHIGGGRMRQNPVGTGPFKFGEYNPTRASRSSRTRTTGSRGGRILTLSSIRSSRTGSTAELAFAAGNADMMFPYTVTFPMLKDIKAQAPQAVCQDGATSESVGILLNWTKPPFDNADVRNAIALTLDRKTFIDILGQGQGNIGGALLPGRTAPGASPKSASRRCRAIAAT